jgi:heme/copper-type cytochrome/quinol oxidase subunit 4
MEKIYSVEQKQKGADLIGGLMLVILTVLSIKGLMLYSKTPENYQLLFSLSVLWLIQAITHLLTYKKFRDQNPYKTQFASWEKEGKIYCYFGIKIFRKVIFYSPFVLMSSYVCSV